MRILVVCGAGASSTFVAQRVRHAAHARGRDLSAVAGTEQSLPIDLDAADIVLVGPHLEHALDRIDRVARPRGTRVILLPADVFGDIDGTRTLALIDAALSDAATATETTPSEGTPQ
ncbi:PTS sugar transporter [Microbacterium sp. W1N]|uniref:PTS sugar transporter subunit IIB n=1 Tax=Microbacterium festucae TaxID=2977531 RepID=UPI0021BF220A|nr:PTS sugar transporter [Microbacterium festucae]MCT9818796.1 PTS sugar transporter [Microbacterium festucae]